MPDNQFTYQLRGKWTISSSLSSSPVSTSTTCVGCFFNLQFALIVFANNGSILDPDQLHATGLLQLLQCQIGGFFFMEKQPRLI
jgi:hypothetical protein